MKPKNPWLALFLSLLCPGLGQFYNGEIAKSFILLFLQVFLLILVPFNIIINPLKNNYILFLIVIFLYFIFLIYAFFSSFFYARSKQENNFKYYNGFISYILYFIFNRFLFLVGIFIFLYFVSIYTVRNNKMYPSLVKGDIILTVHVANSNLKLADCIIFNKKNTKFISRIVFNKQTGNFSYTVNGRIVINGSFLEIGIITAEQLNLLGLPNHENIHMERNSKSGYLIALFDKKDNKNKITYTFSKPASIVIEDNRETAQPYILSAQTDIKRVEGILYSGSLKKIGNRLFKNSFNF